MQWPTVARGYMQSFERARAAHTDRRRVAFQAKTLAERPPELPDINLDHLRLMTDQTGMLQHAAFSIPRYADGYCLDDNARALLLMALIEDAGMEDHRDVRALASRYLAFVHHAWHTNSGRFRNFMSYERQWLEAAGSEDSHGRALWTLGTVVSRSSDPGRQSLSRQMFHAALPAVLDCTSPRAWAYTLLGIEEYLHAFQGDSQVYAVRQTLAVWLLALFQRTSGPEWPWFENRVTYCNARLSQALMVSGARMGHPEMTAAGTRSLAWLASLYVSPDGYFAPIGSNGFYTRGGVPAVFDQQPVEACAMVSACLAAQRVSADRRWGTHARHAFGWFLGQNHLQQSPYDASTGGCRDGLHAERMNENGCGSS